MPFLLTVCLFGVSTTRINTGPSVITSVTELATSVCDFYQPGRLFDLTATCQAAKGPHIGFADDRAAMRAECSPSGLTVVRPGDRLRLKGSLVPGRTEPDRIHAFCDQLQILGHGTPPARTSAAGTRLVDGSLDFREITATGLIVDAFQDEIDANSIYLLLDCQGTRIHAPITKSNAFAKIAHEMVGAKVRVDGHCEPAPYMTRKSIGRIISVEHVTLLTPPPKDLFDAPELGICRRLQPETISCLDRRRLTGTVIAKWDCLKLLVKTDEMQLVNIELKARPAPDCGQRIDVVGLPETDLYAVSLVRARWRASTAPNRRPNLDDGPSSGLQASASHKDQNDIWQFECLKHGKMTHLRGIVRCLPDEFDRSRRLYVESGGQTFQIDVSTLDRLPSELRIGTEIEARGVCIRETEKWRPNATLQNIRGFILTVNDPKDIVILSQPSWWTPARLFTVIAVLMVGLLAVLAWNRVLLRMIDRRGRALFRAQIDKVSSELRISERTRLAVELHDSLSQNLTGVSMEIEAATRNETKGLSAVLAHVAVADKVLKSCRQELKNTLWDLRNEALEQSDLSEAVRRTLLPQVKGIDVAVRISVPRTRLSDSTTHEILCIIRELALNAIRHGHATALRIAGSIEGNRLLFSVRDNGSGFDPNACPGPENGHFGIEGIRERLNPYDGDLTFERNPDGGMRVVVAFRLPESEKGPRL